MTKFKAGCFYKNKHNEEIIYIIGGTFDKEHYCVQNVKIKHGKLHSTDVFKINNIYVENYAVVDDTWRYIDWPEGPNPEQYGCCISNASDETPIMTSFDVMEIFPSDEEVTKFFYLQMMHGVKEFKDVFEFCEKYGNKETLEIINNTYEWAERNNVTGQMK